MGAIRHLIYNGVAVDSAKSATVTLIGPDGPIETFGFYELTEIKVAAGITVRLTDLLGVSYNNGEILNDYYAEVHCNEGAFMFLYSQDDTGFYRVKKCA